MRPAFQKWTWRKRYRHGDLLIWHSRVSLNSLLDAITHCVNVMVDLGLSLRQNKDKETGLVEFEIEPPIKEFVKFPSESTIKNISLSNATKTLLAAEIDRWIRIHWSFWFITFLSIWYWKKLNLRIKGRIGKINNIFIINW